MVKKAGTKTTAPQIATQQDIAEVRKSIDSAKLDVERVAGHVPVVNQIMKRSCTPANLGNAISLLGPDHPKVEELREALAQAGDNPKALKDVRKTIVDTLTTHIQQTIEREGEAVKQQIAVERSPSDQRGFIRRVLFSGNQRADSANEQRSRLTEQGKAHVESASQLKVLAEKLMDEPPTTASLGDAIAKLSTHPDAAALQARLAETLENPGKLAGLRKDVVGALRNQAKELENLGQAEQEAGTRTKSRKGEGAEEMIGYVSMASSLISSSNSAVKLASNSVEGFMGVAGTTVGVAFAGVHIVTESLALRRNVIRLNEAVSRQEGAKLALLPAADRPAKINELEAQIKALSQPRWFRRAEGRANDIVKLQAKVNALKAMGSTEASAEAIAVAKQLLASAAVGHKALRIAKNVAGLAAGAIAIAAAVGALATPIGWIAAGVVFAGTVGLVAYNVNKRMNREANINQVLNNRQSAELEIIRLKQNPDSSRPGTPEQLALAKHEAAIEKSMVQLLTISPKHGAAAIIAGLKATPPDEQMRTLATQALNVPHAMTKGPFTPQREAELQEYLMRGIPIQPKL